MSAARQQLAEWLVAAVVGVALLLLSNLLVPPPDVVRDGHPEHFVAMTQAPFAFDGVFPHRVLWPLLAHVAGWLGIGPLAFAQVCNAALLAVVFWFCRQRGARWLDAALIAAAVAASGAVNVYKPLACLSDPLNLLVLVLTVHFAARPRVFWPLVLLAALSHEMVFFFAPWLVWLRRCNGGSLARDGACLLAVLAGYGAWRWFVKLMIPPGAPAVSYDAVYYVLNNFWVPWGMVAMWGLWALVVVAEFGPLLAVVVAAWRRGELALGGRAGPWLYLACVLSLMLLAYDVFRFATFAFLPLVLGGLAIVRTVRGRAVFATLLAASIATYAWQHPIPSEQGGRAFTDVSGHVLALLQARVDPAIPGVRHFTIADGWSFSCDLLARTWPTFLVAALAGAVCVALGCWLARNIAAPATQAASGSTDR